MATNVFSPSQKQLAKTLMVATGSGQATLDLLQTIWGSEAGDDFTAPSKLPSLRSLTMWKADPRIPIDEQMIQEWADRARAKVLATSELLTDEMGEAVRESRRRYMEHEGNALDVLNLTKSFGILADKLNGRFGNQPGVMHSGTVINGPVYVAYAPKAERPVEVIDAEA